MNNHFENRARQNRSAALILTILVHIAVIAGIVYGKTGAKSEKATAKVAIEQQAKP